MNTIVKKALMKIDDYSTQKNIKRVQGGSINEAFYIETENNRYFLKYHKNAPNNFFELEKLGLELIKVTNTISVPLVLAYSDSPGEAFLLTEWIEGEKAVDTEKKLGYKIAQMHQTFGDYHGFQKDTYIGLLTQPNGQFENWLDYYRDKRLGSQLNEGIKQKRIDHKRRDQLEKLLAQLDRWVPQKIKPSFLHGDLWGGNWITGPGGYPYVIDPSFLFGDRHFELAFTELFSGFSAKFYEAYQEFSPVEDYYKDVKQLYQLYYLLVHLNIFGESYGARVDAVLNKYVGYY